jgi:hypothetical protein
MLAPFSTTKIQFRIDDDKATTAFPFNVIFEELNGLPTVWAWGFKDIVGFPKPEILSWTSHSLSPFNLNFKGLSQNFH